MMKFIVLFLCLTQHALCFPQALEATNDGITQTLTSIQQESQKAVADLNVRLLSLVGVKSNEELLNTVNTQAQSYAAQVRVVIDRINSQVASQQEQIGGLFGTLTNQLSETATKLLGNDLTKSDQVQKTFNAVLEQANNLQRSVQAQGASVQAVVNENLSKIYENTLQTAKSLAQQLDNAATPTTPPTPI